MSTARDKLHAAITRYGNYRENIGNVFKDREVKRRTRHEHSRVCNAVVQFETAVFESLTHRSYTNQVNRAEAIKELEGLYAMLGGPALALAIKALSDPTQAEAEIAGKALLDATETKSIKRDCVTPMFAVLIAARNSL